MKSQPTSGHSPQYERVKKWYDLGKWSAAVVRMAVTKGWITEEECEEILVGGPVSEEGGE